MINEDATVRMKAKVYAMVPEFLENYCYSCAGIYIYDPDLCFLVSDHLEVPHEVSQQASLMTFTA